MGPGGVPASILGVSGELGAMLPSQRAVPFSWGALEGPASVRGAVGVTGAGVSVAGEPAGVVVSSHSWTKLRMP